MHQTPFDRPIFILAAPRSGSTLLFETLMQAPSLWTIGGESHGLFESIPELQPGKGVKNNRLSAKNATPMIVQQLHKNFLSLLRDRDGTSYQEKSNAADPIRMLEKTPKNSLRIPFLNAAFPECMFIYLYREPRDNISSIIDAWRSGRFITYQNLLGKEQHWSLLLPPAWEKMKGKSLEHIAAYQWKSANECILNDLAKLPDTRWTTTTYDKLTTNPISTVEKICEFIDIKIDEHLANVTTNNLPLSRYTLSKPRQDKWLNNAEALNRVLPTLKGFRRRAERIILSKQKHKERL